MREVRRRRPGRTALAAYSTPVGQRPCASNVAWSVRRGIRSRDRNGVHAGARLGQQGPVLRRQRGVGDGESQSWTGIKRCGRRQLTLGFHSTPVVLQYQPMHRYARQGDTSRTVRCSLRRIGWRCSRGRRGEGGDPQDSSWAMAVRSDRAMRGVGSRLLPSDS